MKPSFALNLSHDGLSLLRRTQDGWQNIGEVALDAPDLGEQLRLLRQNAGDLATGPLTCKLIIPNSQILYRRLEVPGDSDTERAQAAKSALDGLTPYALDDLAFDWADAGGGMADVAAVARETLDEAESFASEYRFNPVSFVATPDPEDFPREAFFGTTGVCETVIPLGEEIEPDIEPVTVDALLQPEPEHDTPAPPDWALVSASLLARDGLGEQTEEPGPDDNACDAVAKTGADSDAGDSSDEPSDDAPDAAGNTETEQEPHQDVAPGGESDKAAPLTLETPLFSTRREGNPNDPEFTPTLENMEARFALYGDKSDVRVDETISAPGPEAKAQQEAAAELAADLVTATAAVPGPAAPDAPTARDAALADISVTSPGLAVEKPGRIRLKKTKSEPQKKAPPPPVANVPDPAPAKTTTAPTKTGGGAKMATTFGTRQAQIAQDSSARTGWLLGLGIALVLMAAVLVSSLLFDKPFAGKWLFGRNGTESAPTELTVERPVTETPLADTPAQTPVQTPAQTQAAVPQETTAPDAVAIAPSAPEPLETPPAATAETSAPEAAPSAANTDVASQAAAPEPEPEPEQTATPQAPAPAPTDLTPEELAETGKPQDGAAPAFDKTGIWSLAPTPPVDLDTDRLDNLYVASIDKRVLSNDAIALPRAPQPGIRPIVQSRPPPPPGTEFDLDARGLVRATPQGAMNPDGIIVYAARPPVVPALRPGSAPLAEQPGDPGAQAESLKRLAKIRPVARPENLVEQDERARLGGRSRSELSAMRPVARPTSLQDGADNATLAPTERAVALSPRPRPRPQGFSSAVEKALAEALANPPASDVTTAAVATAPRQPNIPTTASVAREATVKNAISLHQINLIGIYGSSSDRRALVRLKSGRFVKVKVGDRLDGGKVAEIADGKLKYIKRGRTVTLEIAS